MALRPLRPLRLKGAPQSKGALIKCRTLGKIASARSAALAAWAADPRWPGTWGDHPGGVVSVDDLEKPKEKFVTDKSHTTSS